MEHILIIPIILCLSSGPGTLYAMQLPELELGSEKTYKELEVIVQLHKDSYHSHTESLVRFYTQSNARLHSKTDREKITLSMGEDRADVTLPAFSLKKKYTQVIVHYALSKTTLFTSFFGPAPLKDESVFLTIDGAEYRSSMYNLPILTIVAQWKEHKNIMPDDEDDKV